MIGKTLSALVDAKAKGDKKERSEIVSGLAKAVNLSLPIINQILSGDIKCPFTNTDNPLERYNAAAQYLGDSSGQVLYDEAMADGCEYPRDEGEGSSSNAKGHKPESGDIATLTASVTTLTSKVDSLTAQNTAQQDRIAQLEREAAETAHLQRTTANFNRLRQWANKLVDAGHLKPVERNELLGSPDEADEAIADRIACFAHPPAEPEKQKPYSFDRIEAKLEMAAGREPILQTGKIDQDSITRHSTAGQEESDEEHKERIKASYLSMKEQGLV